MKSKEQIDKDREMLQAGVNFPALWVGGGEEKGEKMKGFRLVLDIHAQNSPVTSITGDGSSAYLEDARNAVADPSLSTDDTTNTDYALNDFATLQSLSAPTASSSPSFTPPPITPIPGSTNTPAWATLPSSPIALVSKPSIKTAKSRSISSCLSETTTFALYVRIHAQSVRTKYMMLDDSAVGARLTTRTARWTPFRFEVLKRAEIPNPRPGLERLVDEGEPGDSVEKVLTYGSIVRLVDVHSDTKSDTVKLVKVEKNEVILGSRPVGAHLEAEVDETEGKEEGQPISDLQRIGMMRVDEQGNPVLEDGKWTYLSAPGARIGGGEMRDPSEVAWVWIGRGKKIPAVTPVPEPKAASPRPSLPIPDPVIPTPRRQPETLDEAEMSLINDADLAQAFALPDSGAQDGEEGMAVERPLSEAPEEEKKAEPEVLRKGEGERPAKRLKTKRDALAAAVVAEEDEGAEQTVCTWHGAVRKTTEREVKVGKVVEMRNVELEYVEDWMCWIIAGVGELTFSSERALSSV